MRENQNGLQRDPPDIRRGEAKNKENNDLKFCTSIFRNKIGEFVNHPYVQKTIIFLIVINGLMMGIQTFSFVEEDRHISSLFDDIDKALLIIFTVESTMQLYYHRIALFLDGWLTFDLIIVIISWSLSPLKIVRAFRIFRSLRLITRVKVMRDLVEAIFGVLPKFLGIAILLVLLTFIFAILFTLLYKESCKDSEYFSTLHLSFFTLLQFMTMEFSEPMRECLHENLTSSIWMPTILFTSLAGFLVYNVMVAVICDAISVIDRRDPASMSIERSDNLIADNQKQMEPLSEKIRKLSKQIDVLAQSQKEMEEALNDFAVHISRKKRKRLAKISRNRIFGFSSIFQTTCNDSSS